MLRFSRLFKPTYRHKLWKKQKKKKDTPPESSNEAGRSDAKPAAAKSSTVSKPPAETPRTEQERLPEGGGESEGRDVSEAWGEEGGGEEEGEGRIYCPFELNLGREARPDELMASDVVSSLA